MAVFRQGDLVVVPFDPAVGHEAKKTRPAIVVSNDDFIYLPQGIYLMRSTTCRKPQKMVIR